MCPIGGVGSARLGGGANSRGRSSGRSSDILSIWLAGAIRTSLYHNAPSAVLFRLGGLGLFRLRLFIQATLPSRRRQ